MVVRILFVCHGNICRSPMAEFIMKELVRKGGYDDQFYIESCATSSEELGSDVYPPAKDALRAHGIPFSKRRARRMTAADYGSFDLIIAMDNQNLRNMRGFVGEDSEHKVRLLMSYCGENRGVADPWYTGDFETTYRDITDACSKLLQSVVRD